MRRTRPVCRRAMQISLTGLAVVLFLWGARIGLPGSVSHVPWLTSVGAAARLTVKQTFKHSGHVSAIAFSPDRRYLAAGGLLERSISVWNVKTGTLVKNLVPGAGGVTALAWSPNSKMLAAGRSFVRSTPSRTFVSIWDLASGRLLHELPEPFGRTDVLNDVRYVAFSPDGNQLAAHSAGLAIYDVPTWRLLRTFTGHLAVGAAFAYASDGRYLAVSGEPTHAPIQIYDAGTGTHIRDFLANVGAQQVMAVSPDGRFVVSAGYYTPAINVWDAETGRIARTPLLGHAGPVRALTYSPDGRWLASASGGDSVKLWSTRHGESVESISMTPEAGRTLLFSPDGAGLAFGEGDVVKVWDFRAALPQLLDLLDRKGR